VTSQSAAASQSPTRQQTLAEAVRSTSGYLTRYLAGFDDSNATTQGMDLPNHAAWTLGHCAYTMHRVSARFDGQDPPETDFIDGDGAQGDAQRYDVRSIVIGSEPVDDPSRYPRLQRGRAIYEQACERLARCCEYATDAQLDELQDWHGGPLPLQALVLRICFHNGTHAGQLVDLRRALGLPNVIAAKR